nr:MAG TPA: hypothetical protein [Caudoviricetes sp.]
MPLKHKKSARRLTLTLLSPELPTKSTLIYRLLPKR